MLNENLKNAITNAAKTAGVSVSFDNDNITCFVGDNEATPILRYIDDVQGEFVARVIKPKKATDKMQVVFCNLPDAVTVANINKTCADFVNKYFASAYVRKLISLPNISKITDLLTAQSGAGFVADSRTKPFNALAKILVVALKAKLPSKAKLISEKAIKTFIAESDLTNLTLGTITAKNKTVNASDYINAVIKAKLPEVNAEFGVGLTVDDVKDFAVESLQKDNAKQVESSIDESELDI